MTLNECFNDISAKQILYINASNDEQRRHFNMILLKCMKHYWNLFILQESTPLIYKLAVFQSSLVFHVKRYETILDF